MPAEKSRRLLGTQFVRFTTPGETLTGVLTQKEPIVINGNDTYRYSFDCPGGKVALNGTNQLDDALVFAEVGMEIEIKYIDEVQTLGGFKVKQFEVYVLEAKRGPKTKR